MKEITQIPIPKVWHSFIDNRKSRPSIVARRYADAEYFDSNGALRFSKENSIPVEFDNKTPQGILVASAASNTNQNSDFLFAENDYGIRVDHTVDVVSPYGGQTKVLYEADNTRGYTDHVVDLINTINSTAIAPRTYSFSVKQFTYNNDRLIGFYITINGVRNHVACEFIDGVLISLRGDGAFTTLRFRDIGDGWYRVYATATDPHPITSSRINIVSKTHGGGWVGSDNSFRFAFADFQVEEGTFAGRFVRTTGSSVVAPADEIFLHINPLSNHTLFVECMTPQNEELGASGALVADDGSSEHLSMMVFGGGALARRGNFIRSSALGDINAINPFTTAKKIVYRQAMTYNRETGLMTMAHNGWFQSMTPSLVGKNFNRFQLGSSGFGRNPLHGHIRRVGYWPSVLNSQQLQQLTKI